MLEISLFTIVALVLVLPITIHLIEKNLEVFLLIMGIASVTSANLWGNEEVWKLHLVGEALVEPVMITAAVLIVGLIVYYFESRITGMIAKIEGRLGPKMFCFALICVLGTLSSVITAIMAAIILVEVVNVLKYNKKFEIKLVVLGCFSIGLGAALTPIGEPLSTICVAKLRGEPYYAGFFFLIKNIGIYIVPGIIATGMFGAVIAPSKREAIAGNGLISKAKKNMKDIFINAGKVYVFIMALIFLGTGFKPIIDRYIIKISGSALYWINSLSAVMDNATLTAAEISPRMSLDQIQYILMGILIAGRMLIPGNIPNIISAGRLNIGSKEWARIGVPVGLVMMALYFAVFMLTKRHVLG